MHEIVTGFLVDLAFALIGLLAAYGIKLITKTKQKVEAETLKIIDERQRQLLNNALNSLQDIAIKTVTKIEQTTAKELRQAVKEGKASKDSLKALAVKAYDEIYLTLKPDYRKLIADELGGIAKYIEDTIEEKVFQIKNFGKCSSI